jgi:enoyl-CoA hydratase
MWTEERCDGIAIATYADAPMSYFTDAAVDQLDAMIDGWSNAHDVSVIVLTGGVPGRFVTHFNVDQLLVNQEQPDAIFVAPRRSRRVQAVLRRLNGLAQPVIAALNGDAMGFGFELALSCDIRIAQRGDHRFGLPEVRLGLIPAGSGLTRIVKLLGTAKAFELVVGAKVMPPEETLAAGLIHDVVDDALATSLELARRLGSLPAIAVAMAKKAIYQTAEIPMELALALEAEASFRLKQSPEIKIPMREYLALPLEDRRAWLDPDD